MLRALFAAVCALWLAFAHTNSAAAHASFERSSPQPGASLTTSPAEIRIWLTEPIAPVFSRISLRDSTGAVLPLTPTTIDPADPHSMFVTPDRLPDGLYTVVWRAVSAADGHATEGSFVFGLNIAVDHAAAALTEPAVAAESVLVRTANLVLAALTMGGLGFLLFVAPAPSRPADGHDRAVSRIFRLTMTAWAGWGAALFGLLVLQTAQSVGIGFGAALTDPMLTGILQQGAFGTLWTARAILWGLIGLCVFVWPQERPGLWAAFACGTGILLAQSLFSHASTAPDTAAAVLMHALHLFGTAVWVGGLAALLVWLLTAGKGELSQGAAGRFSNLARVAVFALAVSGAYAAWLHVGSAEALTGTLYGRALGVKMLLFAPVLALAAVNLVWTARRSRAGAGVWHGRLRASVGAELALLAGVLVSAGVLTSGSPARPIQALRDAAAQQQARLPLVFTAAAAALTAELTIAPGTVGENTFTLVLRDAGGAPIEDASRIRLRFEHTRERLGETELRPEPVGGGQYAAAGANLSVPGTWQIRATVQRPGQFDTLVTFRASIEAVSAPARASGPPPSERALVLVAVGVLALGAGGVFMAGRSAQAGVRVLALALCVAGTAALLGGGTLIVNG